MALRNPSIPPGANAPVTPEKIEKEFDSAKRDILVATQNMPPEKKQALLNEVMTQITAIRSLLAGYTRTPGRDYRSKYALLAMPLDSQQLGKFARIMLGERRYMHELAELTTRDFQKLLTQSASIIEQEDIDRAVSEIRETLIKNGLGMNMELSQRDKEEIFAIITSSEM